MARLLDRLKVAFAQADQPQIGADEIDVGDAVALGESACGFGQRGLFIEAVPDQRQAAVGCDNLGFGLFEFEGTHRHRFTAWVKGSCRTFYR